MSYVKLFLPNVDKKATCRPRGLCIEEDLKFVHSIFPEVGFATYFQGFIISQLAKELKQHGITDYHERSRRPELADITRFLSNIKLTREAYHADDTGGAGSVRSEDAHREREPAGNAVSPRGETEEGESRESGEEGRSVPTRPMSPLARDLIEILKPPTL